MANQNTSHILKTEKDKKLLSDKLEKISKKVAKKGMFFAAKNKNHTFDIVDAKTKKPVIFDIIIHELAQTAATVLNRASQDTVKSKIKQIVVNYQKTRQEIEKHYTDIIFYKHTLSTTDDDDKYFIVETRLDMSSALLTNAIKKVQGQISSYF